MTSLDVWYPLIGRRFVRPRTMPTSLSGRLASPAGPRPRPPSSP